MSHRIVSSGLPAHAGQRVCLEGWVHRRRDLGQVRFLILRDRDGLAQVVVPPAIELGEIGSEWVLHVEGLVRAEPRARGGHEVLAEAVGVISPAEPPPVEVFRKNAWRDLRLQTLLDQRAVSLRIPEVLDVFRIEAEILRAFRSYLGGQGFAEIITPKLVLSGAEGGSALFEVAYYERKAYLTQSPQFYKQIMVGSGLERVFEVGHAYRAEKSETSRHLTEFVSLDFEMGFIESEQDVMRMLERVIAAIFETVRERCGEALARRGIALPPVPQPIPQVDFPEACEVLAKRFGKTEGLEGDLDTEGEKLIGQWAQERWNSPLLFITGYHAARRPAYTMPREMSSVASRSFDLLYQGVEIVTGGQRIHEHDRLVASFRARGLNLEAHADYLAAFKHGMPPHGGMGMGLERLTKQLLGLDNVKEASLFPRDRYRLTP